MGLVIVNPHAPITGAFISPAAPGAGWTMPVVYDPPDGEAPYSIAVLARMGCSAFGSYGRAILTADGVVVSDAQFGPLNPNEFGGAADPGLLAAGTYTVASARQMKRLPTLELRLECQVLSTIQLYGEGSQLAITTRHVAQKVLGSSG